MRKLLVVGVVLAALVALDAVAKGFVESQIESRARNEAGVEASASAHIHSFPFVGRLLVTGSAGDIDLRLKDVAGQQIRFSRLSISLADVRLNKAKLLTRKAEITSIDKGVITMGFTAADLGQIVHLPVTMSNGRIVVSVRGATAVAFPSAAADGSLRLKVSGLPDFTVPVPRTRLVNCAVRDVKVSGGELQASCVVEEIPPALLRAAQRVGSA
ncbi:MAG: hypothetical protein QOI20_3034 [Acidimicrobiaceae bacterium]|jgi:hypothetical protein|nr:hypothetical protein [Acidimicrobiaceae bacterium]